MCNEKWEFLFKNFNAFYMILTTLSKVMHINIIMKIMRSYNSRIIIPKTFDKNILFLRFSTLLK